MTNSKLKSYEKVEETIENSTDKKSIARKVADECISEQNIAFIDWLQEMQEILKILLVY